MYKTLVIEGMHCGHCAGMVQVELYKIPEVVDVSISVMKKNAIVRLTSPVSFETFADSVSEAGYTLERLI